MTAAATQSKSKARANNRAFDAPRGNLWSFDPKELCIVGGKSLRFADEVGPIDTDLDVNADLYDERLDKALTEEFINSIDANGVMVPISIAKINGVPTVIAGRRRVRGARVVNARRKAKGEPLVKVDCKLQRLSGRELLGAMITENEGRQDDDFFTRLEKLKRIMARGEDEAGAAIFFNVSPVVITGMLAFEDNATQETKAAARAGRLSVSAASELAKITNATEQNKKLGEMLTSGAKVTTRAVKIANRVAHGKGFAVSDKKTQKKLLSILQDTAHPNISEKGAAYWEGAEEMLKLVMGEEDVDQRLRNKLEEAHAAMKETKKLKASKKTKAIEE